MSVVMVIGYIVRGRDRFLWASIETVLLYGGKVLFQGSLDFGKEFINVPIAGG